MSSKSKSKKGRSRRKVVDSWKLKNWYEVYAPKSFKESFIGQIPSGNTENLIGRTVETLLYDITNNFKDSHIKLSFKVTNVTGQKCETRFIGHELTRDFIRALIHRGSSRVDGIFNYKTADGFIYRVSTFCVTRRRAKGSQKIAIRKIIYQVLNEFAKSSKHGKFVRGIIYGKYAENIAKIVKTIYPLRECQIRKTKLVSFPADAVEEDYVEDEIFEEKVVKLKQHGKQIKSKKNKRKPQKTEQEMPQSTDNKDVKEAKSAEQPDVKKDTENKPDVTDEIKKDDPIDEENTANEADPETEELSEKERKKIEKEQKKAEKDKKKKEKEEAKKK